MKPIDIEAVYRNIYIIRCSLFNKIHKQVFITVYHEIYLSLFNNFRQLIDPRFN